MRRMDSNSVGRLGENFVEGIISALGFDWRAQREKSFGCDGIIEVSRKATKSADLIWAEVKTGTGHLSGASQTHYSVKVSKKHTEYWLNVGDRLAVILIWVDLRTGLGFWTQVTRESVSDGGTLIRIPKSSRLGLHSGGDLKSLCDRVYRPNGRFRVLDAPDFSVPMTGNTKKAFREFYDQWRGERFFAPAYGRLIVSLIGWRHLTKVSRPQNEVRQRLELLPVARLVLSSVYTRAIARVIPDSKTTYWRQTAIIKYRHRTAALVSVIVKDKEGHAATFASVYEHVKRE